MTALVTLAEVKDYLTINSTTFDAKLSNLINYASELVESYCSREFSAANVTYEYKDGGLPYVLVDRPPINNVWSVAEYDGTQYVPMVGTSLAGGLPNVAANANSAPGYSWKSDIGKIYKGFDITVNSGLSSQQTFTSYAGGVRVDYNGGYTTVPSDLKMCVIDIVKTLHKGMEASETRFDREYIKASPYTGGFPPHIRRVLDLYRILD